MDLILEGIKQAFLLLFGLDREVLGITLLSLEVSGAATLISLFIGMSIGTAIALTDFPGKRIVISLINTGMGLPPVVVGLFVSIFLWRNGPFGFLEILYTPVAIVIAQASWESRWRPFSTCPGTCAFRSWPWGRPGCRWSGC